MLRAERCMWVSLQYQSFEQRAVEVVSFSLLDGQEVIVYFRS